MHRTKFKGKQYWPYYARDVKRPGSRPSKWDRSIIPRVFFLVAEKGFTELEIAHALGVNPTTFDYWKSTKPEFKAALDEARQLNISKVEHALIERALGYSHPEEKIFVNDGQVIRVQTIKHYPPDVAALVFYLCNRSHHWSNHQYVHHSGSLNLHNIISQIDLSDVSTDELEMLEKIGLKRLTAHKEQENGQ